MTLRHLTRMLQAALLLLAATVVATPGMGGEGASKDRPAPGQGAAKPAGKSMKLPGLVIDFQKRCVDIEGTICLDDGMLELVACTKGSKEHESVVAITARPMHVHTALLLLGLECGNPAMMKPADEENTRWIHLPPRGDPVGVFLVFESAEGKTVEHAIGDFIARGDEDLDESPDPGKGDGDQSEKFPNTFLFAGSQLRDNGPGPRQYLADLSGNVISIATFGDELLCLPAVYSRDNAALMWRINAAKLPKVGSKVTLRLRPRNKPAAKPGEAERQPEGESRKDP